MQQLVESMKKVHDRSVMEEGEEGIGVPISPEIEQHLATKAVLAGGVVFRKDVFFQMLNDLDSFLVLRNMDKDGWTYSSSRFSKPGLLFRLMIVIAAFSVPVVLALWATGYIERMGPWSFLGVPVAAMTLASLTLASVGDESSRGKVLSFFEDLSWFLWSSAFGARAARRKLRKAGQKDLLRFLFPDGCDAGHDWNQEQLRVRVTLPVCKPRKKRRIQDIAAVGAEMEMSMLTVAHHDAVGLSLDGIRISKYEDPFPCLETDELIIAFPNEAWGNRSSEKPLLDRLRAMHPSLGYASMS